ncbi:multidrug effflux MFS transporter [Cupriavidus pauculus]|uniref:Multidrug effflux MFS transporter n=2 Tax=Cupriavidus pauculus TaxID=82633 RepID=A0A5P2GZT9_9BURK|nr:multidrug effflux MFS transporter [Cupriavidus pauculus]
MAPMPPRWLPPSDTTHACAAANDVPARVAMPAMSSHVPMSRRASVALACTCLYLRIILVTVLFEVLQPLLPLIGRDLALGPDLLQSLLSAATIMTAGVSLLGHPIVDRVGRRTMVTMSAVLVCALGLLSTAVTSGLGYAVILPAILVVNAMGSIAARALLRDLSGAEGYGKVYAYGQAALETACTVAPLAAGVMAIAWGWRTTFAVFCIALLLIVPMIGWFVPTLAGTRERTRTCRARRHGTGQVWWHHPSLPPIALLCATHAGYTALLVAAPFLLMDRFDMSVVAVGAVLSGFACVGVTGYLATGALMARIAPLRCMRAGVFLQGVCACALIALTVQPHVSLPLFMLALATAQLGFCMVVPTANARAMDVPEDSRTAIAGTLNGFLALVGGAAALIASLAYDGTATSLAIVYAVAALAAAGVLRVGFSQAHRAPDEGAR